MPFVFLFPTIYNLAVSSFSTLNPSNYVSGCKTIKAWLNSGIKHIHGHKITNETNESEIEGEELVARLKLVD
jgi:hypothetical protein